MDAIAKRLVSTHRVSLLQRDYYKATHDPLTSLINHISFDERVEHEIAVCERHHRSFALLVLEISHFNEIAQNYSKTAANNILIDFAKRLRACVRQTDSVARLEGDIFAILLPDISNVRHVVKIVQSINMNLLSPFTVSQIDHSLVASIGATFFPMDGDSKEKLMDNAHLAMCLTRNEADKNYCFYTPAMEKNVRKLLQLEIGLQNAIDSNLFDVHYLPIWYAPSNQLSYRQSIVTWYASELRELESQAIAELIESLELSNRFADLVLVSVCQYLANETTESENGDVPVLIELNQFQLRDLNLVQRVKSILRGKNIAPYKIGFVITGDFIRADAVIADEQIRNLKAAGHHIVLDVSSLGIPFLEMVPKQLVDMLRLSTDVLIEKTNDHVRTAIMDGIVGVCEKLQINTLIPNINSEKQYLGLRRYKGTFWQGEYNEGT